MICPHAAGEQRGESHLPIALLCLVLMERPNWILALLCPREDSDEPQWFDPIRVMKGLFLAQNESGSEPEQKSALKDPPYRFQPYSYGPFTQAVYVDLETLHGEGLVEGRGAGSYMVWRLTPLGLRAAREVAERLGEDGRQRVSHARRVVLTRSFNSLLRYVYSRYPESASRSVHTAAKA